MNDDKLNEAFDGCRDLIKSRGGDYTQDAVLYHAAVMCDNAKAFDSLGKKNRWLGFVQGVIWAKGLATVAELKDMNRPTENKN